MAPGLHVHGSIVRILFLLLIGALFFLPSGAGAEAGIQARASELLELERSLRAAADPDRRDAIRRELRILEREARERAREELELDREDGRPDEDEREFLEGFRDVRLFDGRELTRPERDDTTGDDGATGDRDDDHPSGSHPTESEDEDEQKEEEDEDDTDEDEDEYEDDFDDEYDDEYEEEDEDEYEDEETFEHVDEEEDREGSNSGPG